MKKPKILLVSALALALTSTIGMWGMHQTVAAVQDETDASKIHHKVDARLHHEKLTTLLGLTEEQLREKLKSGQSLASIAAEQNVDVQAVIDLHMDNVKAQLDKRLAADKITEEDYNTKMQLAEERIVQHINGEHPSGYPHKHKGPKRLKGSKGSNEPNGPGMKLIENEELTALLGLSQEQLKEKLKSGMSLSEIAEEQGVDVQSVKTLLVKEMRSRMEARIQDKVERIVEDKHHPHP